jgi:hypothetical protein
MLLHLRDKQAMGGVGAIDRPEMIKIGFRRKKIRLRARHANGPIKLRRNTPGNPAIGSAILIFMRQDGGGDITLRGKRRADQPTVIPA